MESCKSRMMRMWLFMLDIVHGSVFVDVVSNVLVVDVVEEAERDVVNVVVVDERVMVLLVVIYAGCEVLLVGVVVVVVHGFADVVIV